MRSLYWLTAVTLVAAAVTTVAIADYGRRHPQSVAALLSGTMQPTPAPQYCLKTAENTCPPPALATERMHEGPSVGIQLPQPSLPPIIEAPPTAHSFPTLQQTSPGTPIRIDDVPEHKQLREEALKNLVSLQPEPPPLPPSTVKPPVVDEFTFTEKPLAPLYVPLQPNAPVVLPPAKMMQEVAKLPYIPGASLSQNGVVSQTTGLPADFKAQPEYRFEGNRGNEVMPGLHAVRPNTSEEDNPVYSTMMAVGELVTAVNPLTYLMSMPLQKKPAATPTSFAVPDAKEPPVVALPDPRDDKCASIPCCPTTAAPLPGLSKGGTCCKEGCCADEVIVRTYSVAEFTTSAGTNHDDLIRLITTMVAPESWSTRDSNIEYFPLGKCIVVRHRNSVQDKVEDLLTQLKSQVVKQGQNKVSALSPVIRMERTTALPTELELVPVPPCEQSQKLPRVVTDEPNRCLGDDEFFGMIPMRLDGRLMPIPMEMPNLKASSLVPAQYQPKPQEPIFIEEGPASKNSKVKPPEFFPWFLPYAPLPNGPDACEEELLKKTGYVNYTDEEIAYLFLMACESEENK